MNLADHAIRAVIDRKLNGKSGELLKQLLKGRDPYTDANLVREAEEQVNAMSNMELLQLVTPVLASKLSS